MPEIREYFCTKFCSFVSNTISLQYSRWSWAGLSCRCAGFEIIFSERSKWVSVSPKLATANKTPTTDDKEIVHRVKEFQLEIVQKILRLGSEMLRTATSSRCRCDSVLRLTLARVLRLYAYYQTRKICWMLFDVSDELLCFYVRYTNLMTCAVTRLQLAVL